MLDDQMQYEKSKDSRAGMFDDYEREKILKGKILREKVLDVNKRKCEVKSTRKWMITQKLIYLQTS